MLALALLQTLMTFNLPEARAMPPQVLADRLLGAGHAPVAKVIVHPVGMEAPTQSLMDVTVIGVPGPASERGWCRRTDTEVRLSPVTPGASPYANAVPTRVESIEHRDYYRIDKTGCQSDAADFFLVIPDQKTAQFDLLARLTAARTLARGRKPLPFTLRCIDADGAKSAAFGGDRCSARSGRTLLATLPMTGIYNVAPAHAADVAGGRPSDAMVETSDEMLAIDVAISEIDGKITRITLHRHVPYPF